MQISLSDGNKKKEIFCTSHIEGWIYHVWLSARTRESGKPVTIDLAALHKE